MSAQDSTPGPGEQPTIESRRYRLRRASATVERIDQPQPDEWITAEHHLGGLGGALNGVPSGSIPTQATRRGESERPRGRVERVLRFAVGVALMLTLVAFFWEAFTQSGSQLGLSQRWRAVSIRVSAEPVRGKVFVGGQPRGLTPLSITEYCKGRNIRIRVEAPGHAIWAWQGLCPRRGELNLTAQLQALD